MVQQDPLRLTLIASLALVAYMLIAPAKSFSAPTKAPYMLTGQYVEGCSCMGVCPCEFTGLKMGCEGVGAMRVLSGSYNGQDIGGTSIAYATTPGKWVRLYVDASGSPSHRAAAISFARSVYADWGKIESVAPAKVAISGSAGNYIVVVNGGKTMRLKTVPVMGADKTTPLTHANVNDPLNHTLMQGKTVSCTYRDGRRSMSLSGTNSFFNSHMNSQGKI